jgi:hypothetical protein
MGIPFPSADCAILEIFFNKIRMLDIKKMTEEIKKQNYSNL